MLKNVRVIAFTVSDLLRENQHRPTQIRVKIECFVSIQNLVFFSSKQTLVYSEQNIRKSIFSNMSMFSISLIYLKL